MKLEEALIGLDEEELYTNTDENIEYIEDIVKIEETFYESLTDIQKKRFEELENLKF